MSWPAQMRQLTKSALQALGQVPASSVWEADRLAPRLTHAPAAPTELSHTHAWPVRVLTPAQSSHTS